MVESDAARSRLYAEVFGGSARDPRGEQLAPMLFVHGWLMDHRVWSATARSASLSAWSRTCVDLRGHGRSPVDVGSSLEAHVDDLLALADAAGWGEFTLVGHSMGGAIAQHLAARAPERVRQLVLVAPVPMAGFPLPVEVHTQFTALAQDRAALRGFLGTQLRDADNLDQSVDIAVSCPPLTVARTLTAWTSGGALAPGHKILAPTLILGGENDTYMSPALLREQVLAKIEGAQLEIMPACGHYPQLDQPEALAAVMAAFLDA